MKKIICTATPFGYGPVSKLITICKFLNKENVELIFVGNGIAFELAEETSYFSRIVPYDFAQNDSDASIFKEEWLQDISLMLNVMEPIAVCAANEMGLRTVYIDSLFWMWDEIPKQLHTVDSYVIQSFVGVQDKVRSVAKSIDSIRLCGPIVDCSYKKVFKENKKSLLVNFSGLENPFVKFGTNMYYPEAVMSSLIEPLNESHWEQIIIVGNQAVMKWFSDEFGSNFRGKFQHVEHDLFLNLLSNSDMLITSPGLTSTYEAVSYEVPVRFMPPQNYSQALMSQIHKDSGFVDISMDWSDIYPSYFVPHDLSEEQGVAMVADTIERFSKDASARKRASERSALVINLNPPSSGHQRQVLGIALSDGTKEVVDIIIERLSVTAK